MPEPNHNQGVIMIMDNGRAKPGVLVGSGRGKSGDGVIETFLSVDLPLRANHDCAVHRLVAARPRAKWTLDEENSQKGKP